MKYLEYINGSNDFFRLKINALLQSDYIYILVKANEGFEMATEELDNKIYAQAITNDSEILKLYDGIVDKKEMKRMKVSIDRLIEVVIPELRKKNISGLIINGKSQVGLIISTLPKDVIIYKVVRNRIK